MKIKEKVLKEVEKKFLKIRGWKNWEQYDRVREAVLPLERNVRNEQLNIAISLTLAEVGKVIDKLAKKKKAIEVDIGEYDKFISCWELKKELGIKVPISDGGRK